MSYRPFTVMLVWSVFFQFYQNVRCYRYTCICGMVGYVIIMLFQTLHRMCQWKNFENRWIIDEDINRSKVPRFYGPPCTPCSEKNTHLQFLLYLQGKCSDFHKIFRECLIGNMHYTSEKVRYSLLLVTSCWHSISVFVSYEFYR